MPQNRFYIVYSQDNALHTENCPLLYVGGRLLFDKIKNQKLLQLKFQNIKNAIINSVTISIELYDNDKKLLDTLSYTYENIEIKRDDDFGEQTPIYLQESEAELFIVQINSVKFYDIDKDSNDIWKNNINVTYEITQDEIIDEFDSELIKMFREEEEVYSFDKYVFKEYTDMWSCTCGALNFNDEDQCHFCEKNKRWIKEHQNKEYLISKIQEKERLKEEELKKEQERLENRPEIVKKLDSFFTKIKNHKWTKLDFIKIGCCIAVIILSYYILNSTFGFGNRKFNIVKVNGNKINILEDKRETLENKFDSNIEFNHYGDDDYYSFNVLDEDDESLLEGNVDYGGTYLIWLGDDSDNSATVGGVKIGDSKNKALKKFGSSNVEDYSLTDEVMFLFNDKSKMISSFGMEVPYDYVEVTGDTELTYLDEDDDLMWYGGAKRYYSDEFDESSYAVLLTFDDEVLSEIIIYNINYLDV